MRKTDHPSDTIEPRVENGGILASSSSTQSHVPSAQIPDVQARQIQIPEMTHQDSGNQFKQPSHPFRSQPTPSRASPSPPRNLPIPAQNARRPNELGAKQTRESVPLDDDLEKLNLNELREDFLKQAELSSNMLNALHHEMKLAMERMKEVSVEVLLQNNELLALQATTVLQLDTELKPRSREE